MISNQILQTTLDGLKAITRIDLGICDTEGKVLASTFTDAKTPRARFWFSWIHRRTVRLSRDTSSSRCLMSTSWNTSS